MLARESHVVGVGFAVRTSALRALLLAVVALKVLNAFEPVSDPFIDLASDDLIASEQQLESLVDKLSAESNLFGHQPPVDDAVDGILSVGGSFQVREDHTRNSFGSSVLRRTGLVFMIHGSFSSGYAGVFFGLFEEFRPGSVGQFTPPCGGQNSGTAGFYWEIPRKNAWGN